MKERIITLLSVAIALVILVATYVSTHYKEEKQNAYNQIELETSSYRTEKKQLEEKLDALQDEYTEIQQGVGSLLLVFFDLDEYFFQDIVPILEEKGIPATLCFSLESIMNTDADFAENTMQSLIDKGWETALYWDGDGEFYEWYEEISEELEERRVDKPTILCIESDKATLLNDIDLSAYGIDKILTKNYAIYDIAYDTIATNTINGIGWFTDNVPDSLTALCDGGSLAYFIGTDHKFYSYRDEQFAKMLENIIKLVNNGEIRCTTFTGAIDYAKDDREKFDGVNEKLSREIDETKKEIENIQTTIDNLNKGNN